MAVSVSKNSVASGATVLRRFLCRYPREVQIYSALRLRLSAAKTWMATSGLWTFSVARRKALELREFLRSVEAGTVYERYPDHFDPTQAVDQRLVQNLRAARRTDVVGSGAPELPGIHRLLGRFLFTCYLEARGASWVKISAESAQGEKPAFKEVLSLPDPESVRRALKRLFRLLGRYFRGNLFDDDLARDLDSLRDGDVVTLRNLITGNDLGSGQLVLPFDVYDFSVIPIETIMGGLRRLHPCGGPGGERARGAYYTPPKLVEFTADLATESDPDLTGLRGSGCGSGVFLVSTFNRMAEAWVRRNERAQERDACSRANSWRRSSANGTCGVDLSLIACQANCFSLYMALLDFLEPPEIRRLGPQRLPSLLLKGSEKRRQNGPQTVIHGDFLASLPAMGAGTDLIIGNPPWVARGNVEENSLAAWEAEHPPNDFPIPAHNWPVHLCGRYHDT